MISKELINSDLGFVLNELGYKTSNAALWNPGDGGITEQQVLDKWEEIKKERADFKSAQQIYDAALSAGFDTGLGFKLSITSESAGLISMYKSTLQDEEAASNINDSTSIPLVTQDETVVTISYKKFKELLIPFGRACRQAYFLKPRNL